MVKEKKGVAYYVLEENEKEFFMMSAVLELLNWAYTNQDNGKELEKINKKTETLVDKWLNPKGKKDRTDKCYELASSVKKFDKYSTKKQREIATTISEAHQFLKDIRESFGNDIEANKHSDTFTDKE